MSSRACGPCRSLAVVSACPDGLARSGPASLTGLARHGARGPSLLGEGWAADAQSERLVPAAATCGPSARSRARKPTPEHRLGWMVNHVQVGDRVAVADHEVGRSAAGAVCTGLGAGGVLGVAKFEAFHV